MGHYHKLNAVNKSRENLYFGCVKFWNSFLFQHCHNKHLNHHDDKHQFQQIYANILLKGTEQNLLWDYKRDAAQFEFELDEIKKSKNNKSEHIWSYKNHIYDKAEEEQIDIKATELNMNELWKLVEYKEKGKNDLYQKYAYPKIWQFEQELLEQERNDAIKERAKQNEREQKKKRTPMRQRNIERMKQLQEENEEIDHQIDEKNQGISTFLTHTDSVDPSSPSLQMGISSKSNIGMTNSQIGTFAGTQPNFGANSSFQNMGNTSFNRMNSRQQSIAHGNSNYGGMYSPSAASSGYNMTSKPSFSRFESLNNQFSSFSNDMHQRRLSDLQSGSKRMSNMSNISFSGVGGINHRMSTVSSGPSGYFRQSVVGYTPKPQTPITPHNSYQTTDSPNYSSYKD